MANPNPQEIFAELSSFYFEFVNLPDNAILDDSSADSDVTLSEELGDNVYTSNDSSSPDSAPVASDDIVSSSSPDSAPVASDDIVSSSSPESAPVASDDILSWSSPVSPPVASDDIFSFYWSMRSFGVGVCYGVHQEGSEEDDEYEYGLDALIDAGRMKKLIKKKTSRNHVKSKNKHEIRFKLRR